MSQQRPTLDVKDQEAVKRILAAVGCDVPTDLDEAALLAGLVGAVHLYCAGDMMRQKPAEQRKRGDKIIKTARRLKVLLDDGENPPVTFQHPSRYCEALDLLIDDILKIRDLEKCYGHRIGLGEAPTVSAFEHLIRTLRTVFETHFKGMALYTRRDITDSIEGPFIRFAEAVLAEAGIRKSNGEPFLANSIASALGTRGNT
jgi:hypothetical protein